MRGRTITHFLVLGGRTKRGVALNEESALNEVVRYQYAQVASRPWNTSIII